MNTRPNKRLNSTAITKPLVNLARGGELPPALAAFGFVWKVMGRIFGSEEELLSALNRHDQLVRDCVSGHISFGEFLDGYDAFYMTYALDGHESDAEERELFEAHADRIAPHRKIWERIISGGLCADEDARKDSYIQAGRFGSDEGLRRLREIMSGS